MELDPSINLADAFARMQGQELRIEVHLRSGESFAGPVRSASEEWVVIGPLAGKEFFEAQVRIADISALSLRTRS